MLPSDELGFPVSVSIDCDRHTVVTYKQPRTQIHTDTHKYTQA